MFGHCLHLRDRETGAWSAVELQGPAVWVGTSYGDACVALTGEKLLVMRLDAMTALEFEVSTLLREAGLMSLHLLRDNRCLLFSASEVFLSKPQGPVMSGKRLAIEKSTVFKHLELSQLVSAANPHSTAAATEEVLWTYQGRLLLWTTVDWATSSITQERLLADTEKVCFGHFLKNDYVLMGYCESGKSFLKVLQVSRHREKGVGFKEKACYEFAVDLDRALWIDEKLCVLRDGRGLLSCNAIKHLLSKQPEVRHCHQFVEVCPCNHLSISAAAVDGRVSVSLVDGFDRISLFELSADKQLGKPVESAKTEAIKVVASSSRSLVTAERGSDQRLTLKRYLYASSHRLVFEDLDACVVIGSRLFLNRFSRWFRLDSMDAPLVQLADEIDVLKAFRWADRSCLLVVSAEGVEIQDDQGVKLQHRSFQEVLGVELLDIIDVETAPNRVILLCHGGIVVELVFAASGAVSHSVDEVEASSSALIVLGEFYLVVSPTSRSICVYRRDNLKQLRTDQSLDLQDTIISIDRLSEQRLRVRLGRDGSYDIFRELSVFETERQLEVEQSGFKLAPLHYLSDGRVEVKADGGRLVREKLRFARYAVNQLADCTELRCLLVGSDTDYQFTAHLHKLPIEAIERISVAADGRLIFVAAMQGTSHLLETTASKSLYLLDQTTVEAADASEVSTDCGDCYIALHRRDSLLILDASFRPLKQVDLVCCITEQLLFLGRDTFHQAVKSARDAHWYVDNRRLLNRSLTVIALAADFFVALSETGVTTHRFKSQEQASEFRPSEPPVSVCSHWSDGTLHLLISTQSRLVLVFVDSDAQLVAYRQLQVTVGCLFRSSTHDEFVHALACLPTRELLRVQVNRIHNTLQTWRVAGEAAGPLVQLLGEVFGWSAGSLVQLEARE